jgi:hypothetical protein
MLAAATSNRLARRVLPGHVISRLAPLLERQRYVQMAPHELFNGATGSLQGCPDTLVFVVSHDSPRVTVERVEARRIVRRMVHSLRDERKELISRYRMFRFGFPERSNELIEKADEIERDRLERLWADREAYVVAHPYPVSPADLFEAIEPLLKSPPTIPEGSASAATLPETAPGPPGFPLHIEQGGR